jgi:hypothetical protein
VLIESDVPGLTSNVHNTSRWRRSRTTTVHGCLLGRKESSRKSLARDRRTVQIHHVMFEAVFWWRVLEGTECDIASCVHKYRWKGCSVLCDGLGTGIDSSTVPMYQSELSKREWRGRLVSWEILFIGVGIVLVRHPYELNPALTYTDTLSM